MPVVSLFELQAAEGRADDVRAILERIVADTKAFRGNRGVTVTVDAADQRRFVVVADWDEVADHEAYLAWRAGAGAVDDLGPLMDGAPGGARLLVLHRP